MASQSPTSRSLELLRERGYEPWVVEQSVRAGRLVFKRDLFNAWDIFAVGKTPATRGELVLVQTTSADNVAARLTKISANLFVPLLREAGIRLLVHGWAKPTKTIRTWRLREEDVS
jgi:hypothetical protein